MRTRSDSPTGVAFVTAIAALALAHCTSGPGGSGGSFGYEITGSVDNTDATGPEFCSLPNADSGLNSAVPTGLCIRRFAEVPLARVMAFAPNGDLFVSAPTVGYGGATGGPGSIVLLHDEDGDGRATVDTFLSGVSTVHGLALQGEWLYFTTADALWRTPYRPGLRREDTALRQRVATYDTVARARPTHGVAVSAGGTVYTSQGVYSTLSCPDSPREGSVRTVDPRTGAFTVVAQGLRNPMYLRCHPTHEVCLAAELGDDDLPSAGAKERVIRLRPETNYGFPCCVGASARSPYNAGNFDCARVPVEESGFPLNDTPFGLDWERGRWPEPFRSSVFVALHGSFYSVPSWAGARVVFARTDPTTHAPVGSWMDVMRGFGPGGSPLERPSDAAFAPDGRLFVTDDHGGGVYWIAPLGMRARASSSSGGASDGGASTSDASTNG